MSGNLNPRQFSMMRPSELLPFAGDRSDKFGQSKIKVLADSISKRGYRASMHNEQSVVTLVHSDRYPYSTLAEGNHRVHAMARIGYDKPIPVMVDDQRTKAAQ